MNNFCFLLSYSLSLQYNEGDICKEQAFCGQDKQGSKAMLLRGKSKGHARCLDDAMLRLLTLRR